MADDSAFFSLLLLLLLLLFFFQKKRSKTLFFCLFFFSPPPPPPPPPSRPTLTLPCDDTSTPFDETSLPFSKPFSKLSREGGHKTASVRREQSTAPGRERCWAATRTMHRFALFVQSGWERQEFRRAYFCGKGEDIFVFFVFFGFFGRTTKKRKAQKRARQFCVKKNLKTGASLLRFYSCIPKCYVLQIRNKAPSFSAPRCDAKSEARGKDGRKQRDRFSVVVVVVVVEMEGAPWTCKKSCPTSSATAPSSLCFVLNRRGGAKHTKNCNNFTEED